MLRTSITGAPCRDDRSVNDRAFTNHARLMKGGAAGEIIACRRAQCTHVITVASRVAYSHTPVDTPSHCSARADPTTETVLILLAYRVISIYIYFCTGWLSTCWPNNITPLGLIRQLRIESSGNTWPPLLSLTKWHPYRRRLGWISLPYFSASPLQSSGFCWAIN